MVIYKCTHDSSCFYFFLIPQQAMVIPLVDSVAIQWHQYIPANPYCASAEGNLIHS